VALPETGKPGFRDEGDRDVSFSGAVGPVCGQGQHPSPQVLLRWNVLIGSEQDLEALALGCVQKLAVLQPGKASELRRLAIMFRNWILNR